jgi:hypothetical protein
MFHAGSSQGFRLSDSRDEDTETEDLHRADEVDKASKKDTQDDEAGSVTGRGNDTENENDDEDENDDETGGKNRGMSSDDKGGWDDNDSIGDNGEVGRIIKYPCDGDDDDNSDKFVREGLLDDRSDSSSDLEYDNWERKKKR